MFTAMVIAMLTAVTVWWLLIRQLREKPWTTQGVLPTSQDGVTSSAPKVGLWVFLAVVSSLFGLFASAYVMRMHGHGGLVSWQRLDEPSILWVNTLVLVLASGALQIARNRIDKDQLEHARAHFAAGGLLTVLFLVGQVLAWGQANANGTLGPSSPAYSFFVLLTAVHGLHLVGGLLVLGRTGVHLFSGAERSNVAVRAQIRLSVQLCTTYWHWLLLIWLGLFALLLST
ncbi:MAG TPA: cytochrome-c oxidase [Gammaproteobacteria bacterium]|jgi:cytochrome c oxidase subunit 3|nr:cytochrome-c oxidase [Gammaproteobacteria bacterium]